MPAVSVSGYHRLLIDDREVVLAVAPSRCHTIDDAVPDARLWGIAAQVYSLRHHGDGGIGDASGIAALADAAGSRGADALALSPMHALFGADPSRFGPYSPSTRLFLNPLHASAALVFGEAHVADTLRAEGTGRDLRAAGGAATHRLARGRARQASSAAGAVRAIHRRRWRRCGWTSQASAPMAASCSRSTPCSRRCMRPTARPASAIGDRWPKDLRDPGSPAVAVFAASHEQEVLFHCFLQWLADRSLAIAQGRARAAGMRIGVIGDLAVGMDPDGSHAWSRQGDVLAGLSIGAPPDLFNPRGQDWGLTGFSPRALTAGGFAPFLATVRAALRNAGGVRIDHAMGLTRLWLIPEGADPADGAYLAYPLGDLLRLLALESQRHGAIVVGEDLGTVPGGFREELEIAGLHGMRVLWFERNGHGIQSA